MIVLTASLQSLFNDVDEAEVVALKPCSESDTAAE